MEHHERIENAAMAALGAAASALGNDDGLLEGNVVTSVARTLLIAMIAADLSDDDGQAFLGAMASQYREIVAQTRQNMDPTTQKDPGG